MPLNGNGETEKQKVLCSIRVESAQENQKVLCSIRVVWRKQLPFEVKAREGGKLIVRRICHPADPTTGIWAVPCSKAD